MIEPGKFAAKKIGGRQGVTSKSGTPYIGIDFQLESGDVIEWSGYLTEKTVDRTTDTLVGLGVADDLSNLDTPSDVKCTLVIEEEIYNGKSIMRVKWVNFPSAEVSPAKKAEILNAIGPAMAKARANRPEAKKLPF